MVRQPNHWSHSAGDGKVSSTLVREFGTSYTLIHHMALQTFTICLPRKGHATSSIGFYCWQERPMLNMTKKKSAIVALLPDSSLRLYWKSLLDRFNFFKTSVTFDPLSSITSQTDRASRGVWNGFVTHTQTHTSTDFSKWIYAQY